jgi:hypothetical protein
MSNKDLFKEAIADAKAIRETALANAKVALEEALAPKLQSMLSAKLQEMEEDLDEAEDKEELEEMDMSVLDSYDQQDQIRQRYKKSHAASVAEGMDDDDESLEEDFDLSSILAELSDDSDLAEAKKKGKKEEEDEEPGEEEEIEDEETEDEPTDEENEEDDMEMPDMDMDMNMGGDEENVGDKSRDKVTNLSVDELKAIIHDIISAEMGGSKAAGSDDEMSMDLGDQDQLTIDEEEDYDLEEEVDLEELLAELDALGEEDDEPMYEAKKKPKKEKEEKEDMKEAIATINTLRSELNEVNLLNAKLLYVNKIFKAKNLNESQKLKVIAQFDKATTTREAKNIYESMNSAIIKSKKSTIKESLGFASKAAGIAPKKPILEVNDTVSRWQMLAGITKY